MIDESRPFDLLLLDYGGVCTPSHHEYLAATAPIEDVRPESPQVIEAAQAAGMSVIVLSNELDPTQIEPNAVLSMVDHVICGLDNKIFKPDRRAYQRALLVSGCDASRTLFVDDDADNVAGANGVGMATMLFDPVNASKQWAEIAKRLGVEP